jgi:hypothetical protein
MAIPGTILSPVGCTRQISDDLTSIKAAGGFAAATAPVEMVVKAHLAYSTAGQVVAIPGSCTRHEFAFDFSRPDCRSTAHPGSKIASLYLIF